MKSYSDNWLPQLKDSIPEEVKGTKVSSYAIALEGWRRGLTLKYINVARNPLKIRYSLSNRDTEIVFAGSRGSKVSKEAVRICIDKFLTKKYLMDANVPTPEGEKFERSIKNDEIVNYAKKLGFPVVVKPVDGSGGTGVIANINSEKELLDALDYVRNDLNYDDIIVEKFFKGIDYRVYVIGEKVVAAFDRIPANVIGDGVNTIEKLIKLKIDERQKNPALYNRPIKIDKEVYNLLQSKGYDLNTIPKKGERVFLKTKNNVSSGGDSRDVTDELTDEIKEIAINATKAIPGLLQAGLDIIVDKEKNTGVVLEINARPSIRNHLFPMEGKARDIPKEIIDYYFPETKDKVINPNGVLFYFELKTINNIFRKGLAKEVILPKMPRGDIEAKAFKVSGKFNFGTYEKHLRKHVRNLNLHGYMKHIDNNHVYVVLAGKKENMSKITNIIRSHFENRSEDITITEENYSLPIKIGFEVKRNTIVSNKIKEKELTNKKPSHAKPEKQTFSFKKLIKKLVLKK